MILHIDMDAYYASVEQRDHPELAGQPVVVGGTPEGRGVVAAANYEARKFGIHSALPAATAVRLCPHAVFIRPRMSHYAEISEQIRAIFHRYTPLVEPLSLDEAFLDVKGSERLFGSAVEIGQRIKSEIRDELGLTASVGVAPNKFLAKIASDLDKPDGFTSVEPGNEQRFLDPLPVGRLWGVGQATGRVFDRLGIQTIGQLRQVPQEILQDHFGNSSEHLWKLARGIDRRAVVPDRQAKSISHETTFAQNVTDIEILRAWLLSLTEQVARRVRKLDLKAHTVQLKLRYSDFHTVTRAARLPAATDVTQIFWETAARLLTDKLPQRTLSVRLIGIGVSGLSHSAQIQPTLFPDEEQAAQARLDRTVDQLRERFGGDSLGRGSDLAKPSGNRSDTFGSPAKHTE